MTAKKTEDAPAEVEYQTPEEIAAAPAPTGPPEGDYDLVRVRDNNSGAEYTTSRAAAQVDGVTVLDKPALDDFGAQLPPKPNTPKGVKPTSKESA